MKKLVVVLLLAALVLPCAFSAAYVSTNTNILSYTKVKLSYSGDELSVGSFAFGDGGNINAQLGYVGDITEKSQLGVEFGLGFSSSSSETEETISGQSSTSDSDSTVLSIDLNLVGRDKLNDKLSLIARGGFHGEFVTIDSGLKQKINCYGIGFDLGALYAFGEHANFSFGLKGAYAFSLDYEIADIEIDLDSSSGFSIAPYVGIAYFF